MQRTMTSCRVHTTPSLLVTNAGLYPLPCVKAKARLLEIVTNVAMLIFSKKPCQCPQCSSRALAASQRRPVRYVSAPVRY